MKRTLSRILVTSGMLLGCSLSSAAFAQQAVKPDAAKGEELFNNGDMSRGLVSCSSCHGVAGNSTLPINPNLASQPY